MIKNSLEKITILKTASLVEALKKMDIEGVKLLIVVENGLFYGLISIGDIQRAIINNKPFSIEIQNIIRSNIFVASAGDDPEEIKQDMLLRKIEFMPVVNDRKEIVDVLFWEDLFKDSPLPSHYEKINLPVVIMAGGRGERLKPLTNVIPKPLIPLGEKPIIDEIIESFQRNGCNKFYISVNYMSDMIRDHFLKKGNYENIEFIQENKPLGTAGSLFYLKGKISSTFFVNNCDVLIKQNYAEIYNYHRESRNEITIVASLKSTKVPYGLVETEENGRITGITEKPYVNYMVNTGLYLLEPHLLDELKEGEPLNITSLIEGILARRGRAGSFPISEDSWFDIGEIGDYWKLINSVRVKQKGHEY
ncbi:MAG: CBS domain-containing protein [Bacteroidia bacterium]|nr:MAG: CBS domain-containing protein [Bacteroidia bacterium]